MISVGSEVQIFPGPPRKGMAAEWVLREEIIARNCRERLQKEVVARDYSENEKQS